MTEADQRTDVLGPQREAPLVGVDGFVRERGRRERGSAQEMRLRIVRHRARWHRSKHSSASAYRSCSLRSRPRSSRPPENRARARSPSAAGSPPRRRAARLRRDQARAVAARRRCADRGAGRGDRAAPPRRAGPPSDAPRPAPSCGAPARARSSARMPGRPRRRDPSIASALPSVNQAFSSFGSRCVARSRYGNGLRRRDPAGPADGPGPRAAWRTSGASAIACSSSPLGFVSAIELDQQRTEQRQHVDVARIGFECAPAACLGRGEVAGVDQRDRLVENGFRRDQRTHDVWVTAGRATAGAPDRGSGRSCRPSRRSPHE